MLSLITALGQQGAVLLMDPIQKAASQTKKQPATLRAGYVISLVNNVQFEVFITMKELTSCAFSRGAALSRTWRMFFSW